MAQWLACWARNPKVPGSKPGSANTIQRNGFVQPAHREPNGAVAAELSWRHSRCAPARAPRRTRTNKDPKARRRTFPSTTCPPTPTPPPPHTRPLPRDTSRATPTPRALPPPPLPYTCTVLTPPALRCRCPALLAWLDPLWLAKSYRIKSIWFSNYFEPRQTLSGSTHSSKFCPTPPIRLNSLALRLSPPHLLNSAWRLQYG